MSQSRKSNRKRKNTSPVDPLDKKTLQPAEGRGQQSRAVIRDILFGLLVCLVFFAVLEAILRVWDLPTMDPAEDPYVGFSATKPLYEVKEGIASTADYKLKAFNQASFSVPKRPNTMRVFCFGGSTTYGHPFDARSSFSRWLEDLLKASSPEKNFEVINAGGISYASYRIVPLIKETLQYEPDLMVIYTGHNEFLERRTYSGLFEQGGSLVSLRSLLEDLRIYQALKRLIVPLLPAGAKDKAAAKPEKSVLKEEATTLLDRSAGTELYHRDEQFSRGVVQHFAHNLRAMILLCRKAGVPVVVVQPPSNIKDFSPFKSEHSAGLGSADKRQVTRRLSQASQLVTEKHFQEALSVTEEALVRDPLYAESYYWKGKALLGLGRAADAKANFVKARDLDVCPLRCISDIDEQIVTIARQEEVVFIPFAEALERKASELGDRTGIPGNECFLDHVHPTIELHQLLAETIVDTLAEKGLFKPSKKLTPDERQAVYTRAMNSLDTSFFALRDLNLAKTLRWAGKKAEARAALQRVAQQLPDDVEVHKMMGSYLLDDGKYDQAVGEYEKAAELSGNETEMMFGLATAYHRAGKKKEAEATYERLRSTEMGMAEADANLAMIHLEGGRTEQALALLGSALKKHAEAEPLLAPYALALVMSGKTNEAIPWMIRAVNAEPGNANHLYNLAGMYALAGNRNEAIRYLDEAVQKGYANPEKAGRDPVFATIRDLPEFRAILERMN
ncbi:MAG: tetratricopeptide repeat protein [Desulfomonile tiedjei]|nr:tetratricopeptide repeat protein [Desulfomonile tiedjei]